MIAACCGSSKVSEGESMIVACCDSSKESEIENMIAAGYSNMESASESMIAGVYGKENKICAGGSEENRISYCSKESMTYFYCAQTSNLVTDCSSSYMESSWAIDEVNNLAFDDAPALFSAPGTSQV